MIIGLDWDDTVTEYTTGFKKLVECATEIHIITLNNTITEEYAKEVLSFANHLTVHIMPDEEMDASLAYFGIGEWKANKCLEVGVDIMFDDMKEVVDSCIKVGVPAIQVQAR